MKDVKFKNVGEVFNLLAQHVSSVSFNAMRLDVRVHKDVHQVIVSPPLTDCLSLPLPYMGESWGRLSIENGRIKVEYFFEYKED